MLYYKMNSETIVMCVVALILGMLMANMLKSVCGCKVVEGLEQEQIYYYDYFTDGSKRPAYCDDNEGNDPSPCFDPDDPDTTRSDCLNIDNSCIYLTYAGDNAENLDINPSCPGASMMNNYYAKDKSPSGLKIIPSDVMDYQMKQMYCLNNYLKQVFGGCTVTVGDFEDFLKTTFNEYFDDNLITGDVDTDKVEEIERGGVRKLLRLFMKDQRKEQRRFQRRAARRTARGREVGERPEEYSRRDARNYISEEYEDKIVKLDNTLEPGNYNRDSPLLDFVIDTMPFLLNKNLYGKQTGKYFYNLKLDNTDNLIDLFHDPQYLGMSYIHYDQLYEIILNYLDYRYGRLPNLFGVSLFQDAIIPKVHDTENGLAVTIPEAGPSMVYLNAVQEELWYTNYCEKDCPNPSNYESVPVCGQRYPPRTSIN
jgi:hypothetical protein